MHWLDARFRGEEHTTQRIVTGIRRARTLAWALGLSGAVACIAGGGVSLAFGAPASFLLVYLVGVLMGLLGALVASRHPGNSIGWLMCATSLAASLTHLPAGYGYAALVVHHGTWPLGSAAVWLGAWGWTVVLGLFVLICVRFPDGHLSPQWRSIDWLAIAGAALFAFGIALQPARTLVGFVPIPASKVAMLLPAVHNALAVPLPATVLKQVQGLGLTCIVFGYVAAVSSLALRYQRGSGEERLQLKWFAYAGVLFSTTLLYGAVAWNFFGQPLYLALTPLEFASLTLPVAIAVAILRYRLYDIDLIINKTLVYGGLTAILGAVYAAVVTLLNRFFISVSGQKSDAAFVVTAFVVVIAASPLRDWMQRQVDRRVAHRSSSAVLDEFSAGIDSVVSVIDGRRVAIRFVDQAVVAFDATAAALYLGSAEASKPNYTRGRLIGESEIEVPLRFEDQKMGRLVLGPRRGGVEYTDRDRDVLQRSADSVGEALALAAHLAHIYKDASESAV
jgi:MFS family permease